eukprot:352854-Chlamydomonas_euryale.AAC.7
MAASGRSPSVRLPVGPSTQRPVSGCLSVLRRSVPLKRVTRLRIVWLYVWPIPIACTWPHPVTLPALHTRSLFQNYTSRHSSTKCNWLALRLLYVGASSPLMRCSQPLDVHPAIRLMCFQPPSRYPSSRLMRSIQPLDAHPAAI